MESDRLSNTLSDGARDGQQRGQASHGRKSGPTRRSTKGQWTAEEDEILCMAVQRFKGKNWKKIAECFKDRTDVQCLHRWQKVLNPDLVKGPWSKEEDEIIIEMVNRYGPKKWSTIAQHLPGRIGKQCRERWHNHLNPNINKEAWTQEEELALIRAHQVYGNKWAELTKYLPGRTDNSIKNHWNSSVKKKLDMYMASGLLSQFQGPPVVSHSNHSAASSSSKAQQSSEDYSTIKDKTEVEEASDCSQPSAFVSLSQPVNNEITKTANPGVNCRATQEPSPFPCSEDYRPAFEQDTFPMGEIPCEVGEKFLEHDLSVDWGNFAGKYWQLNGNGLPDMSLLDLGQESSGLFMTSLNGTDNHESVPIPLEISTALIASTPMMDVAVGTDTSNFIANSDCRMVYSESGHDGCFPSENMSTHINGTSDSLFDSNYQMREDGNFVLQSYYLPSDMSGASFTQPSPIPPRFHSNDCSLMFSENPNQSNYPSHENAERDSDPPTAHDVFISDCIPCEDNSDEAKGSPRLVAANNFVMAPQNDSQCIHSRGEDPVETDELKKSGALFYEPPRFPGLDMPFFSCDLIQSGSDMHQDYSPLGIRQLMISSMTPFKLWDSPARDDSPVAVLRSAAKTFTGTPSILKKRHRDLVSPLSEKRSEKKQEASNLRNDLRLEDMFNECIGKEPMVSSAPNTKGNFEESCADKENVDPEMVKGEGNQSIMSKKDFNSSDCPDQVNVKTCPVDVKTDGGGNDEMEMAKEFPGILVEHDMNDLLFLSPDRFGIKSDRAIGLSARALGNRYSRRLEAVSKNGVIQSSAETSYLSVLCSPRLSTKKDGTNLVITTSLQSMSPAARKAESSCNNAAFENGSIFVETPFKRSIESPSAWKSPWLFNSFVPGPRVDTDITIEDIGYLLSPGDRSYDAIGLMKELGEQTASAFADAQEILGDETPETIMKEKSFTNKEAEKENGHCPNSNTDLHNISTSNLMAERRTLDFSECGTPVKDTEKHSSSIGESSPPSSYLLKSCR